MDELSIFLFIDYDNLLPKQKEEGILDVVMKTLIQSEISPHTKIASCHIRIYGGWYEGSSITRAGEDLTVQIQTDFPKIIRIPVHDDYVKIKATAELAVSLLQDPSYHLFNTFRRKGRPRNIRVVKSSDIDCDEPECLLPLLKNLFKKGKCPRGSCGNEGEIIYRSEQKIVDTMLTCDLMFSAETRESIIVLISSDDDFLPPLRSIVLRGIKTIRVHPKRNNQRVNYNQGSVQFSELEL